MMRNDSQLVPPRASGHGHLGAILVSTIAFLLLGGAFAQPRIVVSIPPYLDLLERIAGSDATVETLLPPGASPHSFEPSPRAVANLAQADLVVVNGGVDEWALRMVASAAPDVPVLVVMDALTEGGALAHGGGADESHAHDDHAGHAHAAKGEDHEAEHGAHDHGDGVNPHVWLDPLLMAEAVPALADALGAVDAVNDHAYDEAAERLVHELHALDDELREMLAPVAGATFVPFHDAWPHFAQHYGLDLLLEIEPFPGREPSARELAAAVDLIRSSGARAIFNEDQLADRPARVLAAEAGVEVATLDPLGGVEGRYRYEDLLRFNAERIVAALSD